MSYPPLEPGSQLHNELSALADDSIDYLFYQAKAVGYEDEMRLLALLAHACMARLMDPDFDPDEVTR